MLPSPESLAFLSFLAAEDEQYMGEIQQARDYDAGIQFVALTARLRQFLGGGTATDQDWRRLRLNICRIITSAVTEKMKVDNFDSDELAIVQDGPTPSTLKPQADWAWKVWRKNGMDSKQKRVHDATVRDGESFVIVEWDDIGKRPIFYPHLRYVDQSVGTGSHADVGEGCRAFYLNDDEDQQLLYVTKRWTEVYYSGSVRQHRQRWTIYYPDRIEKYAGFPGAWERWRDSAGEPWPIPLRHADGSPLGIPVAHFRSTAGMEAKEAWPLQNAINKAFVDLMQESDVSAFRIFLAFGWKPVDRNGNPLEIKPGTWMGSESKDARGDVIPGGDLSQFMNLVESIMIWAAMVTDTPVSRFIATKQVAAEGTQKQGEGPLLAKIRTRQSELGNAWERCFEIARRMENTYGAGGLDEAIQLYAEWAPAEARDEDAELARAQKKQQIGVPYKQVLIELGYDLAQVEQWAAEREKQKAAEQAAKQAQALPFAMNGSN